MLQTHLIAELLDMEAFDFEGVEQNEQQIILSVRMKRRTQECPACRMPCDRVHDYRLQRVKDSPIQGKIVAVHAAASVSTRATIFYRNVIGSRIG
jgi:transposase